MPTTTQQATVRIRKYDSPLPGLDTSPERWRAEVDEIAAGCYGSTPERALENLVASTTDEDGTGTLAQRLEATDPTDTEAA